MDHHPISVTPSNIGSIISAIESDLRGLITLHLEAQKDASELLTNEIWEKSLNRLKQERGFASDRPSLQDLLLYIDFADVFQILNSHRKLLPQSLARALREITPRLEKLVPVRNRLAHNRPLFYDDCDRTEGLIQDFLKSTDISWDYLKIAVKHIQEEQSAKDIKRMQNLPVPDYEETGFIGRKKQVEDLIKHCLQSPYPVISVIGDGGVGKTAITLKAAYDILKLNDCPFDSIVWTSSKTTQLTPQEIKNIENAISTSTGIFQDISDYLAPEGIENPFEEVLAYLSNFKILLILDNLETVLDDQIRQFLGNLPTGSKVLITSRIGVGAYDVPFKLRPLDGWESIQLLRALANIRQVKELAIMPNSQLEDYCKRMKNNPLFIKWFVSAVQTGKRPEEILDQRHLLLEFCMSNVYKYLSDDSHRVLMAMLCIPSKHSQAELAFLTNMDAMKLEVAIRQLRTTTMFTISSDARDSSFDTSYELSDLARDYLSKHHPVSFEEERELRQRQRQLVAAIEMMNAEQESDPYSFFSIQRRSKSDIIVAKYLKDAVAYVKRREFREAENALSKARNLAPGYFEVYRVEAFIKVEQDNYSAARTAYEAAIELNDHTAPLRVWYGGFLMRYQNEPEEALKQFKEAAKIDSSSPDIQLETARANLYLRRFADARMALDSLLKQVNSMRAVLCRKVYDLDLQYYRRKAEHLVHQRDKIGAFDSLEKLKKAYQSCPPSLKDDRMKDNLRKAYPIAKTCALIMQGEVNRSRADELIQWYNKELEEHRGRETKFEIHDRLQGAIVRIVGGRNFGFLRSDNGKEFFFGRFDLANQGDWDSLYEGGKVFFWVAKQRSGPTSSATNVIIDGDLD